MINRLVIIGVGLIGGSLARAVRAAGHAREIVGVGRSLGNLQQAVDLGVVDRVETSLGRAVRDADMVVLASPVGAMADQLHELAPYIGDSTVITDAGSVKGSIVAAARSALGPHFANFIPGHPLAGREKSGVTASVADLYQGQRVILTPLPGTSPAALAAVEAMWRAAGATLVRMKVDEHDEILAATSHLPHLLAYALMDLLVHDKAGPRAFDFIGNGFRDMTRIAGSDPVMWRDICLANRAALLGVLQDYSAELAALALAIEQGDAAGLEAYFARNRQVRNSLDGK
jgi:prephenate dehydrogenase